MRISAAAGCILALVAGCAAKGTVPGEPPPVDVTSRDASVADGAVVAADAADAGDAASCTTGSLDLAGCACSSIGARSCYTGPTDVAGTGACVLGKQQCTGGTWGACVGAVEPQPESCNGVDDNCDGVVDEGCSCKDGDKRECYGGPAKTLGVGACHSGKQTCSDGGLGTCDGQVMPKDEECNGIDDDCNGIVDDMPARACYDGASGTQGVGGCHAGTQACDLGTWGDCTGEVVPVAETCNLHDDDCNGVVDDLGPRSCYDGPTGTDAFGTCHDGTQSCVTGAWTACSGSQTPGTATCDGADHDCDGVIDPCAGCAAAHVTFAATGVMACGVGSAAGSLTLTFDADVSGVVAGSTVTISGGASLGAFSGGPRVYTSAISGLHGPGPFTVTVLPTAGSDLLKASCGTALTAATRYDVPLTTCATTNVLYVSAASGADTNDGASAGAAKKTIHAAVAAATTGTEIRVAEGTYAETITVTGCKKIFGGYDATFATRDPATHVTTITSDADVTLTADTSSLHLDGVTVENTTDGDQAVSMVLANGIASNDVIRATNGYAFYAAGADCAAFHDNWFDGEWAYYDVQSGAPVYSNRMTSSYNGASIWQSKDDKVVRGNVIDADVSGFDVWKAKNTVFDGNRASGGTQAVNDDSSLGGVVYVNNDFYGGAYAMYFTSANAIVTNDTLVSPGAGIYVSAANASITNNLIAWTGTGLSADTPGIDGDIVPASIENNVFVGYAKLYDTATDATHLNAYDGKPVTNTPVGCFGKSCWTMRVGGNATTALALSVVLTSPGGVDGHVATMVDDDWSLATTEDAILHGAKDASTSTCGSHESPVACGGLAWDVRRATRHAPLSVGAYERDP